MRACLAGPRRWVSTVTEAATHEDYLLQVLNARVYDACVVTPLQHAVTLSSLLENDVYLKREVELKWTIPNIGLP